MVTDQATFNYKKANKNSRKIEIDLTCPRSNIGFR